MSSHVFEKRAGLVREHRSAFPCPCVKALEVCATFISFRGVKVWSMFSVRPLWTRVDGLKEGDFLPFHYLLWNVPKETTRDFLLLSDEPL